MKMYKQVIELDIWSQFGCFNKSFSNKGGLLTYSIPTKTSIIGMIGAVLGIEFDKYTLDENNTKTYEIEKLYDIKISVQPLFDLKTTRVVFNNCGKTIANINQDLLVNPKFKLFISFPDSLSEEETIFIDNLKSHTTVYNLYMGRNEFPLTYEFIRTFENESKTFTYEDNSELEDLEIYGFIKRSQVDDLMINAVDNPLFKYSKDSKPFFEYLVKDYPIKRKNFTEFDYEFISFYPDLSEDMSSYFSEVELKKDCELELTEIGDEKWICLL